MATVPEKLYRIGEIVSHTGLSRQTIHNYTMLGLIKESKRAPSGHRLYDAEVFNVLERITILKRHRTLTEIRDIFQQEEKDKDGGEKRD
ncbi:MAG: MerR family transcriptional regulator [Planctomycetes bacterium]|nr:MerR family transcriptional regulator [Planctomycetota bacterium]